MKHLEVELRYKVHNVPALIAQLAARGIPVVKKEHLIDQWFMPTHVKSQTEEHTWFDENRGIAWRVRRTEQASGDFTVKVESKQLSAAKNHNTFIETTADISDYDQALQTMRRRNYRCWLTIDKTRLTFATNRPDMTVVLDEIAGLAAKIGVGAALELEFTGTGSRVTALRELRDFAKQLGFSSDDQFDKSLTVEAMSALADFGD